MRDLRRRQDLDHSVVALDQLMLVARRRGEHREDRSAHPTRAHPRDVEVTVGPAVGEEVMVVAGERVVVAVEDGDHCSTTAAGAPSSTAGSPSMLCSFFSRW